MEIVLSFLLTNKDGTGTIYNILDVHKIRQKLVRKKILNFPNTGNLS